MPDEHTPHSSDQDTPARRVENAAADFVDHVQGARNPGASQPGSTITSIKRNIVGLRRGEDTVDAVEALGRLFTAIGDLLRLAQADREHDSFAADATAGDGEPTGK